VFSLLDDDIIVAVCFADVLETLQSPKHKENTLFNNVLPRELIIYITEKPQMP
jgi:hypothetical protein